MAIDDERPTWRERFFGAGARERERTEAGPPIEIHEHIEVEEEDVGLPSPEQARASRAYAAEMQRMDDYHRFLEERRVRRFRAAGLLTFAVGILGALWFVQPLAGGNVAFTNMGSNAMWLGAVVVLVAGIAFGFAAGRGNLAGLVLGWILGLLGVIAAVAQMGPYNGTIATAQILAIVLGIVSFACLAACTVGIASWRGVRVQDRILGRTFRPGARGRAT
jgi:hypothetical protein